MKNIKNERDQLKNQEYNRRKKYYEDLQRQALLKTESKLKTDYGKKFEKSWKRYESKFDEKTTQLVKNDSRKESGKKVVKYKTTKKVI